MADDPGPLNLDLEKSVQQSPSNEITIGIEHMETMVQVLGESRKLLELPRSTLTALTPYLRHILDHAVFLEVKYNLEESNYGSGRSIHDNIYHIDEAEHKRVFRKRHEDLKLLASFPGYALSAISMLIRVGKEALLDAIRARHSFPEAAQYIDQATLHMLRNNQQCVLGSFNRRQRKKSKSIIRRLKKFRDGMNGRDVWVAEGRETVVPETNPVFRESLRFTRALHSREVLTPVVYKVAGHVLPVELVDAIAECLYDQDVLDYLLLRRGAGASLSRGLGLLQRSV